MKKFIDNAIYNIRLFFSDNGFMLFVYTFYGSVLIILMMLLYALVYVLSH